VEAKFKEILAVRKQILYRFHTERYSLKKLYEVKGKEQYNPEISKRFSALENLDEVDINRAWETIIENIKISAKESLGYYEMKKHKPRFDEGCSKLLHEGKKSNCSGYRIQVK
jgi:hypothetical protein